jgi:hypothetical protein
MSAALPRAGLWPALVGSLAAIGLSACLDIEAGLAVKPDGMAHVEATARLDPEMQDVFGFVEAVAQIRPEVGVFTRNGLCPALEFAAALNPEMKLNVRGKQGLEQDRFFCAFDIEVGGADDILRPLPPDAPASQLGIMRLTREGARRVRLEVDLGAIPDFTPQLMEEFAREYMRGMGLSRPPPLPDAMERFTRLSKAAAASVTKLVLRDRYLELSVSAPRIIQTNGVTSGQKVAFRWPWTEIVDLALKAETRRGKRYFVVFEY